MLVSVYKNGQYGEITDTNPLPVQPGLATTATGATVNDSNVSQPILAANPDRKGVVLRNNSSATLYLDYGASAAVVSAIYEVPPLGSWEMPVNGYVYTGQISGIWSADSTGAAYIRELT